VALLRGDDESHDLEIARQNAEVGVAKPNRTNLVLARELDLAEHSLHAHLRDLRERRGAPVAKRATVGTSAIRFEWYVVRSADPVIVLAARIRRAQAREVGEARTIRGAHE